MKFHTKIASRFATASSRARKAMIITAGIVMLVGSSVPGIQAITHADQYDDQINNIAAQSAQTKASLGALQAQANTYEGQIAGLQAQISTLNGQIADSQAQQAALQAQIAANVAEIAQQKSYISSDVKAMYVDGTPTTLEVLATSKDLSDFVDKQKDRSVVASNLKNTVEKITALQQQLQQQKITVDNLLKNQDDQQAQLADDQAQQAHLLSLNQAQQNQYDAQLTANNASIVSIRAAQTAAYARLFGSGGSNTTSPVNSSVVYKNLTAQRSCGGGYPSVWCGQQDSTLDNWSEYNRECVSYVAWFEAAQGHYVPTFGSYHGSARGNANQWAGVLTDSGAATLIPGSQAGSGSSLVGDAVYIPIGGVGHVAAVLSSSGDGWVHVGQYNITELGQYSEMDLKITPNLIFFQFH